MLKASDVCSKLEPSSIAELLSDSYLFKDKDNEDLLEIDIYLQNDNIEIKTNLHQGKLKILGAKIDYLNAFYHCYFHLEPQVKFENFKVGLSFNKNHKSYQSGLFFNCVSLGTEK